VRSITTLDDTHSAVRKSEDSSVSDAKDAVTEATKRLREYIDRTPQLTEEDPTFKALSAALESARAYNLNLLFGNRGLTSLTPPSHITLTSPSQQTN
jgi:hypothetical protein